MVEETRVSTPVDSAGQVRIAPTICRLCSAHCGVLATITDGRLTEVTGDPDNPMYRGYTCPKGRALPEFHNNPTRLLHSRKREADGSHAPIPVDRAMDEIARRLQEIVEEHGPRSVAVYTGTSGQAYPGGANMAAALLQAIGSPMFFTPNPIDSPGKQMEFRGGIPGTGRNSGDREE